MVRSVTKTVKVPASKAEEWDSHIEENPEVDSTSHLIRLAVENEISGTRGGREGADTSGEAAEDRRDKEILTALNKLQTSINDLDRRMSSLEGIEKDEASYDLRRAVYSFLPEERDDLAYDDWAVTPEELARSLGADETDVRDSLDRLDGLGEASSVTGGPSDKTYWFKRGE